MLKGWNLTTNHLAINSCLFWHTPLGTMLEVLRMLTLWVCWLLEVLAFTKLVQREKKPAVVHACCARWWFSLPIFCFSYWLIGGLDFWDRLMNRIIAKVRARVPWESQSTNPDPNHQVTMSWLLFFFPNGFGSWFPVCRNYQKPTVDAETPKDMSPLFAIARITSVTLIMKHHQTKQPKCVGEDGFNCFSAEKTTTWTNWSRHTEAAMLVTLSSRTNLSREIIRFRWSKEIRRIDSGDAVPRAVPTSAALPVGPKAVGWKFRFVGYFWRIWIDI